MLQNQASLPKSLVVMDTPKCPKSPLQADCPVGTQGGVLQPTGGTRPSVSLQKARQDLQTLCCWRELRTLGGPEARTPPALWCPQGLCPLRQRTGVPSVLSGCSPVSQPHAPIVRASMEALRAVLTSVPAWVGLGPGPQL